MTVKERPLAGGLNNQSGIIWRRKINNFLINYFAYLAVALSVIIFVAGWLFLLYPQYRRINQDSDAVRKNLRAEYNAKLENLNEIISLRQSYEAITAEDKEKIKQMLPPAGNLSELIPLMENIALRNGAVLNSVKVEADNAKGSAGVRAPVADNNSAAGIFLRPPQNVGLIRIEISLSLVSYAVLKNILKTFENNLRLFDVAKLEYGVNDNRATFNIFCYYLKD